MSWRKNRGEAGAVGQSALQHGVRLVNGLSHELRRVAQRCHERSRIREGRSGASDAAAPLDEDLVRAVDHHLGDGGIIEVGSDRREKLEERLVEDA